MSEAVKLLLCLATLTFGSSILVTLYHEDRCHQLIDEAHMIALGDPDAFDYRRVEEEGVRAYMCTFIPDGQVWSEALTKVCQRIERKCEGVIDAE